MALPRFAALAAFLESSRKNRVPFRLNRRAMTYAQAAINSGSGTFSFQLGDAGTFTVSNDDGTAIFTLTDGGAGADTAKLSVGLQVFAGTATPFSGSQVFLSIGTTPVAILQDDGGGGVIFGNEGGHAVFSCPNSGGANPPINLRGLINQYNAAQTAGIGVDVVYAIGAQTLVTNAAPTTLSYTPPATAGRYRLTGMLNIKTVTTGTVKIKVTFKDAGGTAQTDIPVFIQQNSATLLAGGPAANSTGRFWFSMEISIDNSATPITIADNAGTYTSITYYWVPSIEQIG